jgi:hypothetical protein
VRGSPSADLATLLELPRVNVLDEAISDALGLSRDEYRKDSEKAVQGLQLCARQYFEEDEVIRISRRTK